MSMLKSIELKLGNMRKPQDFTIYPFRITDTRVIIQSNKTIASIDPVTGDMVYNSDPNGAYFVHLSMPDRKTGVLPKEDLERINKVITDRGIQVHANISGTTVIKADNSGFLKLLQPIDIK